MASSHMTLVLCFLFAASLVSALQVSPNSPCASVCIDSPDLDKSDPGASNILGKDITCLDQDYGKPVGQKFQTCLSCLQGSGFSQGGESDQDWFLYNLRFSFGYCTFGYPNATSGTSPCVTDPACGPLKNALEQGIPDASKADAYSYCSASNGAMLGDAYEPCRECVRADGLHNYLSNFLVALEAGCQQKPVSGVTIGLNETIFSNSIVTIVQPKSAGSVKPSGMHLSSTNIAVIAIGALILSALTAGCIYMQVRRRRNRAARAKRARDSAWSFRCQTHLTPRNPEFPEGYHDDDDKFFEKKAPVVAHDALYSNPVTADTLQARRRPANITTTIPAPPPVHSSPKVFSPDDYNTPTSTTSNAPLLRPYMSSDYASSPPMAQTSMFRSGSSPLIKQSSSFQPSTQSSPLWEEQQLTGPGRDLVKKKGRAGAGAPVEISRIQTSFAPPPRR